MSGEWGSPILDEEECWASGGRYDKSVMADGTTDWESEWTCWMNEWSWCSAAGGYKEDPVSINSETGDWDQVGDSFCNCQFVNDEKCDEAVKNRWDSSDSDSESSDDEEERRRNTFNIQDPRIQASMAVAGGAQILAGATIWFEMASNPTTGYDWIVEFNECQSIIAFDRAFTMDEKDMEMMGVGGTTTIQLQAVVEGNCVFRAAYAQDWDFGGFDAPATENNADQMIEIPITVSQFCNEQTMDCTRSGMFVQPDEEPKTDDTDTGTGTSGGSYSDWIACHIQRGSMCYEKDPTGVYASCFTYGEKCEGNWYDCYYSNKNCDATDTDDDLTFDKWIDCWENTESMCYDEDPYGDYSLCYNSGENCEEPGWYDCYHNKMCDGDTTTEGNYENFNDWMECYQATMDTCGASHSEHYDCYWENEGCQDPWWHDCYWYGEGCDDMPDFGGDEDEDYINGYFTGYTDGYTDGVLDTAGPVPEEKDPFHLELITQAFANWVDEEEQRAGRFHCGQDIRIDFPFEDTEHMALWAAHDCDDWDLYVTVVTERSSAENAIAYSGAEPSMRRGCYETLWFDDVDACEFYLPHGGPNFGILFQGGFHAIWYEYEWEYAPAFDSWFGGW